jgi:hypothetical protein
MLRRINEHLYKGFAGGAVTDRQNGAEPSLPFVVAQRQRPFDFASKRIVQPTITIPK